MKAKDAMIVWTPRDKEGSPTRGEIDVLDVEDGAKGKDYACWLGRGDARWTDAEPPQRLKMMFSLFHRDIVLRDKIAFEAAHKAFSKIDEYVEVMTSLKTHAQLLAEREHQREALKSQGTSVDKAAKAARAPVKDVRSKLRRRQAVRPTR
jgi:hypothetical protein